MFTFLLHCPGEKVEAAVTGTHQNQNNLRFRTHKLQYAPIFGAQKYDQPLSNRYILSPVHLIMFTLLWIQWSMPDKTSAARQYNYVYAYVLPEHVYTGCGFTLVCGYG